jgi:transcriptional regulator with XRE-family HTH domain
MAEALGIDRSYLSEIEAGKKEICLRNLDIVAQGFGMSIAKLMSGV